MGFNKAFADFAIAFFKIEITGLAAEPMEFFGLLGRRWIAFHFTVKSIFAGLNDRGLRRDFKFVL